MLAFRYLWFHQLSFTGVDKRIYYIRRKKCWEHSIATKLFVTMILVTHRYPLLAVTRHCKQINCLTQTVEHAYFHKWPAGGVVNPWLTGNLKPRRRRMVIVDARKSKRITSGSDSWQRRLWTCHFWCRLLPGIDEEPATDRSRRIKEKTTKNPAKPSRHELMYTS